MVCNRGKKIFSAPGWVFLRGKVLMGVIGY